MNDIIYLDGRFLTQKLSGVQRFAYEITNELLNSGLLNIRILVPNTYLNKDYKINNWPIIRVGFLKGYLWEQVELPFWLKRRNTKILLCLCNIAPLIYKRKITVIHDLAVLEHPEWFNWKFVVLYNFFFKNIIKSSMCIITVSNYSKKTIIKHFNIKEDSLKVIYNAVSTNFGKHNDNFSFQNILNKYGLITNKYLLTVSSIDPRKNINGLITAFHSIKQSEYKLVIVGKSNKIFAKSESSKKNENIIQLEDVKDFELSVLYKLAYCFIYPSFYEGFGIPPLEAMASGTPTIVSNTTSLPEVCGDASLYFNPFDVSDIGHKIEILLNNVDLRQYLINKGNERIKKFSWGKSATEFLNILSNKSY